MKAASHAFTLLELLVAMVVLVFLVLIMANMVDSTTKLWRDNENRVDAYREARSALNLITSDLRSIIVSTNTNYFSTNAVGASRAEPGGLYFITALCSDAQPGGSRSDLCTVGYFRRWDRQNSGFPQTNAADPTRAGYHLFRTLYGADQTYTNLVSSNPLPLADLSDPSTVQTEILARNVCSLEFRLFQTNSPGNAIRFVPWTYSTNNPMPQLIEVRLTAISDDLAKKLNGDSTRWTTNDALVKRDMRSFVSRVQVPGLVTN